MAAFMRCLAEFQVVDAGQTLGGTVYILPEAANTRITQIVAANASSQKNSKGGDISGFLGNALDLQVA